MVLPSQAKMPSRMITSWNMAATAAAPKVQAEAHRQIDKLGGQGQAQGDHRLLAKLVADGGADELVAHDGDIAADRLRPPPAPGQSLPRPSARCGWLRCPRPTPARRPVGSPRRPPRSRTLLEVHGPRRVVLQQSAAGELEAVVQATRRQAGDGQRDGHGRHRQPPPRMAQDVRAACVSSQSAEPAADLQAEQLRAATRSRRTRSGGSTSSRVTTRALNIDTSTPMVSVIAEAPDRARTRRRTAGWRRAPWWRWSRRSPSTPA